VVVKANGRDEHELARTLAGVGRPSWLPGSRTIFVPVAGRLYDEVDAATGQVLVRRDVAQQVGSPPTLAPNGKTVLFIAPRPSPPGCEGEACEVFALYSANTSTGRTQRLFDDGSQPGWSPDSHALVLVRAGVFEVRPLTGAPATPLPTGDVAVSGYAPPTWQPR
jgi:Tol biopolymer transport system component